MKLSLVFLCLSLATLSLASTSSAEEEHSLSSSKQVEKNGSAFSAAGRSSQAAKKIVRNRKRALRRRLKKKVGAPKGSKKTFSEKKSSAVSDSGKSSQEDSAALNFLPKVLVELIGGYLEGFSVVFERKWSAVYNWDSVAVDSERHYLITRQDVQASSHRDGKPVSLGSPDLSDYSGFQSSHDGRSVFFTSKAKEQVGSEVSSEKTARWLVQDTDTKILKSVAVEGGEIYAMSDEFMLSKNGKTLLSMSFMTYATSVYQIKEHGETVSASKKADINGYARAVSGNGNRIFMEPKKNRRLEIHDISGDRSHLVLEISYAEDHVRSCALNSDGSKAAFIDSIRKLYIVDVGKEGGSISVDQLTPIGIPSSVRSYSLIYDAKDRLYVFGNGSLWLVDPSKHDLVSLEQAEVPQGYAIQSSAVSSNGDYIALLIRSKNEKEEHQYRMIVKRKEDTKDALIRLCECKS